MTYTPTTEQTITDLWDHDVPLYLVGSAAVEAIPDLYRRVECSICHKGVERDWDGYTCGPCQISYGYDLEPQDYLEGERCDKTPEVTAHEERDGFAILTPECIKGLSHKGECEQPRIFVKPENLQEALRRLHPERTNQMSTPLEQIMHKALDYDLDDGNCTLAEHIANELIKAGWTPPPTEKINTTVEN